MSETTDRLEKRSSEHHMEMARKLSENAVLKGQLKALREMRKDLLEACEATEMNIKAICGAILEDEKEDAVALCQANINALIKAIDKAKKDWE